MNALIFFLPLVSNGLEVPNFRQRERQTDFLNDFDQQVDFRTSNNEVLTGLWSEHNNDREDRRWRAYVSSADEMNCLPLSLSGPTPFDGFFDFRCPSGHALAGFQSRHSNDREDREWRFSCCDVRSDGRYRLVSYETSHWQNSLDRVLDQRCNENQVMVGLASQNNNDAEDRWYWIRCALLQPVETRDDVTNVNYIPASRLVSGYVNDFDIQFNYQNEGEQQVTIDVGRMSGPEAVNYRVIENVGNGALRCPSFVNRDNWLNPPGAWENAAHEFRVEVLNGRDVRVTRTDQPIGWELYLRLPCSERNFGMLTAMFSEHSNDREDRRFGFSTVAFPGVDCRNPMPWTDFQNNYDEELRFTCPRGFAMVGIGSRHDNGREDRIWQFRCCEVARNGYELGASRNMALREAPNSDFEFDWPDQQGCEANEVMVGLSGWHSNSNEDRRYSIQCAILARPPPPAPTFDNCVAINVLEAIFEADPVFAPEEEELAELQTLATDLNFCGNPRVPTEVTIAQSGEESVSKSETLEIERSLDTVFSFAAGINAALNFGVEVTRAVERKIRSRSTSVGFDFLVGASADAGISFGLGTARTSATTVSTTSVTANSIQTNIRPLPFQRFVSVGSRRTQEVTVPMRMRLECVREDGGRREETILGRLVTQGTTNIEVSFEDKTNMCPQSYYRNCECVPDLKSNFVGTGCVSHPDFTGHPGCYVYRGNGQDESCTNGEALQTTSGASDEGVDGIAFGFSYIPCGGDQYYPGDARFVGISFDDLVLFVPRTQCLSGTGGTLSNEPFATRNAAIEACFIRNLENPDTCAGVYDPQCDNAGQFFLCSVEDGLNFSNGQSPSCTYRLQDTTPDPETSPFPTPENGFTRSVPSLQSIPPFAGRRLDTTDDELLAPAAWEELAEEEESKIQLRRL